MDRSKSLATSLLTKRWINFIAAVWLQTINGTNFDFSDYSSSLKKVMGINQIELNSLAVASDLGKIMGWVSGMACMFLPTWVVLGIAMALGAVGYGIQWLMLSEIIQPLQYWQVYILCLLAGNSICWFNTVSFRAAIENFPNNRGIASGLSTSYVGLSTVIYTSLSSIVDPRNPSLYLLLNSMVPAIVGVISAILLHISHSKIPIEDKADHGYMLLFTLIAIATAIYSIILEFLPHGKRQPEVIYMGVLILFLLAPLYVPLKVAFRQKNIPRKVTCYNLSPITMPAGSRPHQEILSDNRLVQGFNVSNNEGKDLNTQSCPQAEKTEEKNMVSMEIEPDNQLQTAEITSDRCRKITSKCMNYLKSLPPLGEEHNIGQLLLSTDFWLYYFVYFCGGTVGMVYINNLGQIVQSLGYSKTPILVSLVSSFGFLGRIASGLPDYIQQYTTAKHQSFPRPGWIGIWMVPMAVAFFMLAITGPNSSVLYVSTAIVGTSCGAISTIAIPVSSELFGMERFGVNHNILITNIAFGSLLFGEGAGVFYDHSASKHRGVKPDHPRHFCIGKECYANTFWLWGSVCSFGIVLCVILSVRTRKLYESIRKQHPAFPANYTV
eukprot:Gb_38917 [translate_table: standard]